MTIRLGRIAGLTVALHWSVVVIAGLFSWSLATVVLPDAAPDHSTAAYWATGVVGAVVLLASLLGHELAHAIVARRAGVEVRDLTLWLFGGVARLGREPTTPGDDLRIAVVGPAVSLGLSLAFALLASILAGLGSNDLLVATAAWLFAVNLLLGVFNLLPGAPLDGGRVLRAVLWRRHGDWARAASSAARAGQVVAYVIMSLGLVELLAGFVGGLWPVLVGWFMLVASQSEQASVITRSALRGVRVGDVMSSDLQIAPAEERLADFIDRYLLAHPHSAYPVQDAAGRTVGLVTLRQLRAIRPGRRASTRLADITVPLEEVPTASPDAALVEVLERDRGDDPTGGRILVLDGPALVGIVSPSDIARIVEIRRTLA